MMGDNVIRIGHMLREAAAMRAIEVEIDSVQLTSLEEKLLAADLSLTAEESSDLCKALSLLKQSTR